MKYYKLLKVKGSKLKKVQGVKMNKEIEDYWDKVAKNWIEKLDKKEKKN